MTRERDLLDEARDHLLLVINVIDDNTDYTHISNEAERDQALDSFCAWARTWVQKATP